MTPSFNKADMFYDEIDAFLNAAAEGKKIRSNIGEVLVTARMMDGLYESAATGGRSLRMRKIGFIDYFLDEWHANNYPAWIADPRNFGRYEIAYAWADADKPGGLTTGEWCAKFRVARSASIDELIGKSDCVAVLSPDNPERHEALSELALRSGKPVYVDKTFAVTREAADRMFDLAEKYSTPMYSTSALRYAKELGWLRENGMAQADVQFASARGPGIFAELFHPPDRDDRDGDGDRGETGDRSRAGRRAGDRL